MDNNTICIGRVHITSGIIMLQGIMDVEQINS